MKFTVTILFGFCLLLASAKCLSAKEWRGVIPLRSTRDDVARLFNQCSSRNERCEFSLEQEIIRIIFSGAETVNYKDCPNQLAPGTVLQIEMQPKAPFPLADLHINKKRYRTFDPSSPRNIGYRGYLDEGEGIIIKTYNGQVVGISYIPVKADRHLCPKYYENPKTLIQVVMEHVPIVLFQCPTQKTQAGEKLIFSADYPDTGHYITINWNLSKGKIISGQGTRTIIVDTTGLEGQTIKATVERADETGLIAFASCEVQISQNVKK